MLLFQVVRVFQTLPRSKQWRSDASQSAVAVSEQEKGQARPHYLDPLRQFLDSGSDPPIDLVSEEPALLGPGNDASTRFVSQSFIFSYIFYYIISENQINKSSV